MFFVFVAHVALPNDTLRGHGVDEDVNENVTVINVGLSESLLLGLDFLPAACCWDIIL